MTRQRVGPPVKRSLDALQPRPDGYNVGFNAGEAASQTVKHLHMIPLNGYYLLDLFPRMGAG